MLTFPYGTGGGSFAVSVYDNDGVPYSDPTPTGTGSLTNRDPGDLCSSCTFIEWGDLNANVQFGQFANGNPYDDTLQGFWIAGDMPTIGDLPLIGTATYAGTVYGTVIASGGNGSGPYTATGGLGMEWDFAQRAGTLEIVNFDNGAVNVSGTMRMPGVLSQVNSFSGPLNGTAGTQAISGGAAGSFVANGNDATAGVIGNWNVRNNAYRATGIFGGGRTGSNPNGSLPPF